MLDQRIDLAVLCLLRTHLETLFPGCINADSATKQAVIDYIQGLLAKLVKAAKISKEEYR